MNERDTFILVKMMYLATLVVQLFGLASSRCALPPKVCVTPLGCLEGVLMPGYQSDKFEAFMGIPFAQPPVGELRFANPKPALPWEGVLNASVARADCIQKNYLVPTPYISGEEDCLYLNIYRPLKRSKKPLPVMVYIFGGGFFSGTASPLMHGPEYFMDTSEVILVVIAYRLGALGFLSTGDDSMPGNFGLKDQNLALRWVQKYISAFGGNPKSVTIFGQSAGGISCHMHILSSQSAGLFQRAIIMSGNAEAPFATLTATTPMEQARQQAELCNIRNATTISSEKLVKALREIDAKQIVESGDGFKYWSVDPMTVFRPVVEAPSPDAFLTEDPIKLSLSGKYKQVPWMTGTVPNEGAVRSLAILVNETLRNDFNANFDLLLYKFMELPINLNDVDSKMSSIVDFYFNGEHELNNETAQAFVDIVSDRGFIHPFYHNVKHYVATADLKKNPVYLYKFNYRGSVSYSTAYTGNLNNYGVVHCDDLIYLFRSPLLFGDFNRSSTEALVIKEMVDTYVTFAKTGKPKGSDQMKECNARTLLSRGPNKICDYREIRNDGTGFSVVINNAFDLSRVKLWDNVLFD